MIKANPFALANTPVLVKLLKYLHIIVLVLLQKFHEIHTCSKHIDLLLFIKYTERTFFPLTFYFSCVKKPCSIRIHPLTYCTRSQNTYSLRINYLEIFFLEHILSLIPMTRNSLRSF